MTASIAPRGLAVGSLEGGYGSSPVLHGVTFYIGPGEVFGVLGKNGMGKTTLLKTIMGLLPPRRGQVELLGKNVIGWPPYQITRLGVSYIPRKSRFFRISRWMRTSDWRCESLGASTSD